jgi:tetratricopeptide (TPR) repeat protein
MSRLVASVVFGCFWAVTPVRADTVAQRQSAHLYVQARGDASARAERLRDAALHRIGEGMRTLPGDYRRLCERTQRLLALHEPDRDAPSRALEQLARQARQRSAHIEAALGLLDRAIALEPRSAQLRYTRARALALWERPEAQPSCRVQRRSREAIAAFEEVQALDPQFEAGEVAFRLGLLHTLEHAFSAAQTAYRRAIALALDPSDARIAYGNLAEVTMLAGDPAGALRDYDQALAQSASAEDYALLQLGAAVALDRLGEHEAAVTRAQSALESSGRSLSPLRAPGVFFEPESELHEYEGLGNEALAALAPEAAPISLDAAAASYRAYLDTARADDPYRRTAQANLEAVQRELAGLTKSAD